MATTTVLTSGCVKWFNNKAGYGFISVKDCAESVEERDLFVHHSEIKVEQTQYKYLVQGEYVEFIIAPINREGKTDTHATNVRGINSGKLMCETRQEVRSYRTNTTTPAVVQMRTAPVRHRPAPATIAEAALPVEMRRPQLNKADQTDWMVVPRRRTDSGPLKQKNQPRQRQPGIEIA